MIVKPSVSFLSKESDGNLIAQVGGIVAALTGNASYPTPAPTLAVITAALDEFTAAVSQAMDGGVTITAMKNEKRAALVTLMRQLASYVQVACKEDMAVLLSSGFPVQKPQREPIGVLQPPSNLTVTFGPRRGELRATAAPVTGASIYNWQISSAASPAEVVQSIQTTAANCTFASLTPGVVYRVVVNVVGAAGPSSWSEPVPQMAV